MSPDLIKKLGDKFGPGNVRICSQFHVQIKDGSAVHNLWDGKDGYKVQLSGKKKVRPLPLHQIISYLASYNPAQHSDIARMEEALALSQLINRAARQQADGVFVDAGFKGGKAKIAVIMISGDKMSAESYITTAADSTSAEIAAINFALTYDPWKTGHSLPIFTDSQNAVSMLKNPRVKWIRRDFNVTDRIANLRKKD